MSLSSILKEIETNRPNAEMDIQMGSPNTYGGRVGLKRAATEALIRLKNQYSKELLGSASFIVVTGSGKDAFTELATNDTFECFSSDPEEFFKDLVSRIDKSLFGRENTGNLFNIANRVLYDKAMELGLGSYVEMQFSDRYNSAVNSAEDLVPLIRDAISDKMGAEIVGINAASSIADRAIKKGHAALVTPILLNTNNERFALDLLNSLKRRLLPDGTYSGLTKNVFLVVAGKASKALQATPGALLIKTVNEEAVGEALTKIRTSVL